VKEEAYVNIHFNVTDTWTKAETNNGSQKSVSRTEGKPTIGRENKGTPAPKDRI
jgi:hypothetical protein